MNPQPSRAVVFPGREELRRQMAEHRTTSADPALQPYVLDQLAGRELEGRGVHMGLAIAFSAYQEKVGLTPVMAIPLWMNLPGWARALVQDPEVLDETLASIQQVHGDL